MQEMLNARFAAPLPDYYRRRIIVWMDESGEFGESVEEMTLKNARVLVMRKDHMFETRRQIEVDYAEENLLLYCPMAFDRPQDNWLLDVFLYSEEFRADYWSLLFDEMNIENSRPMREYARTVSSFFASKERRARLRSFRPKYANEKELETGIFCVLCGLKSFALTDVVREVLSAAEEESPLPAMAKFCEEDAFWNAMEREYGYTDRRETSCLANYLLACAAMVNGEKALEALPGNAAWAMPAYGLFVSWLREDKEGLLDICRRAEEAGDVSRKFAGMDRDVLMRLGIYPAVDQALLAPTLRRFAEGRYNTDEAEMLLRARADQPWYGEFAPYYAAVRALTDMQLFYMAHREGFHYGTAAQAWRGYESDLYRMDQAYRAFLNAYENALNRGVLALEDDLKAAQEAAERLYKNWFLAEMGQCWTDRLEGMTLEEALPAIPRQEGFYGRYVSGADSRVFVVISDGLRYEVARELADRLNGMLPGNTVCSALVAAIPTVTPVGMAALLPHRRLRLEDDLRVRCDGMNTDAANREAVLRAATADSLALNFEEFRQMPRAQRQELVKGAKVVYIYHDAIDASGESGGKVFAACETAMNELALLMRVLVNELSAANVCVTADHGFIYTHSALEEYDKADRDVVEGETLEYKRRHAIVKNPRPDPRALFMPLTGLGRDDLTGVFPRGGMRFRLQGSGSTYMHGGLLPQEMMVPLLRYQNKKAGQRGFKAIAKTDIALICDEHRISNGIFTLVFYQRTPCSGKVQARQALARFEDERGAAISDEHRVIANSVAQESNERTTRITFRLLGSNFDREKDYYLVLTDAEDGEELLREPFRIDIVFGLDFDF